MSRRVRPPPLEDGSWILEGDDESSDAMPVRNDQLRTPMTPSRRSKVLNSKPMKQNLSPAPELVMPSMNDGTRDNDRTSPASRRPPSLSTKFSTKPSSGSRLRKATNSKDTASDDRDELRRYIGLLWSNFLLPLVSFISSTFGVIFNVVRPILTYLLAFWLLALGLRYLLRSTLARSMAPICYLPGISYLHLPFCPASPSSSLVEFDQLMNIQSTFEDVLSSSAGGASLPLDMKRGEASIRDLKHVVQFSSLPSRNELVFEFTGFIETARQASGDLTRFNSRIGRAVDNVLNTNRWTLQVIDGVAEWEAGRGAVGRLMDLTPFHKSFVSEELVLEQYLKHTSAIEEQIAELIVEAQALLGILQNLDDRLDVIHGITTRDGVNIKGDRDELLAQLWTWLGGNRSSLKKQGEQLTLLQQVGIYRKTAWEHVSGTVLKLQSIAAGLEDLRERVAAPEVLGRRTDVPLRLHVEHIQQGVERLEAQRMETRRMEGEMHRKVLDRGIDMDSQQNQRAVGGDVYAKLQ